MQESGHSVHVNQGIAALHTLVMDHRIECLVNNITSFGIANQCKFYREVIKLPEIMACPIITICKRF